MLSWISGLPSHKYSLNHNTKAGKTLDVLLSALILYAQLFSIRFYVGQDSIRSLDGVFFDIQYTAG
jgi:hypothetical protein